MQQTAMMHERGCNVENVVHVSHFGVLLPRNLVLTLFCLTLFILCALRNFDPCVYDQLIMFGFVQCVFLGAKQAVLSILNRLAGV